LRIGTVQDFGELTGRLEALERSNKAQLISNPVITTTDNREARILVGQRIPLIMRDEAGNGVVQLTTIGIMLRVTPHINSPERITLDIVNEVSDLSSQATVQGGVIINTSESDTRVMVGNGETAIIAGLIRAVDGVVESGVPLLKDIPLLGTLFKHRTVSKNSRELVIFVTPRIVTEEYLERGQLTFDSKLKHTGVDVRTERTWD
jgi:type II secretory pathway component GspD/PulD (secretin)